MLNITKICCKARIWHKTLNTRQISALYITGDKAKENYVTLQPFLDFDGTLSDTRLLEKSLAKRRSAINLSLVLQKYQKYRELHDELNTIEKEQTQISNTLKQLTKNNAPPAAESESLKEHGRTLRKKVKELKQTIYPVEDDFIHDFLGLPNILHKHCPIDGLEKVLYRSNTLAAADGKSSKIHLSRNDIIKFVDNTRYYMLDEAAEFDILGPQEMVRHFVGKGNFTQTANPDFVRCVLLEAANATPISNYHMVKEENLQNSLNVAYLTGGGAFESYLGAVTKLCVYPSVLPLRLVCCGRSYVKNETKSDTEPSSLYTATQTNAVQTFVATQTSSEADEQMERILNLCVDFYKSIGVPFRICYVDASYLMPSESLRANIQVYSPALKKYVCVGHLSNYSNFISKRILFSTRHEKNYHFLHIIGGPVLYTTRLIAALLENDVSLAECLRAADTFNVKIKTPNAVDEFKNLFK